MQKDKDKLLTVSIVYDKKNGLLRVADNAMGMSLLELEHVAPCGATASQHKRALEVRDGHENSGLLDRQQLDDHQGTNGN